MMNLVVEIREREQKPTSFAFASNILYISWPIPAPSGIKHWKNLGRYYERFDI